MTRAGTSAGRAGLLVLSREPSYHIAVPAVV